MATAAKALEKVREICLSLPETSEAPHFGAASFRVGKKMFASCGVKDDQCVLVVQLQPEHAARLLASDPRITRYSRAKDCVMIDVAQGPNWADIRSLVVESYRLIASSDEPKPKRPRSKRPKSKRAPAKGKRRK